MFGMTQAMLLRWMVCQTKNGKKYYLSREIEKPFTIFWTQQKQQAIRFVTDTDAEIALKRAVHNIDRREETIAVITE